MVWGMGYGVRGTGYGNRNQIIIKSNIITIGI
jgi:hypothetical protein